MAKAKPTLSAVHIRTDELTDSETMSNTQRKQSSDFEDYSDWLKRKHEGKVYIQSKNSSQGKQRRSRITAKTVRASQRWQFEKPEKRPCVTYSVPIDQLTNLDHFVSISEPLATLKPEPETVTKASLCAVPAPETKTPFEIECSRKLAALLSGETEAVTEAGRVDVLTSEAVIELKQARNWKHGIGQLLAYGFYFPEKTLALVLIGSDAPQFLDIARFHCDRFSIQVSIFNF